uniref:SERPIN domain-containing protein n=1 Tax=Caenorhabditis tropicalis TaxID=1561998 RepID=A0A1I7U3X9_9PELO
MATESFVLFLNRKTENEKPGLTTLSQSVFEDARDMHFLIFLDEAVTEHVSGVVFLPLDLHDQEELLLSEMLNYGERKEINKNRLCQ